MVLGILCARYFDAIVTHEFVVMVLCVALLAVIKALPKINNLLKILFGVSALTFFFFLGVHSFNGTLELPDHHFTHHNVIGKNALISFELSEQLTANAYNTRYYATLSAVENKPSAGKILVLFKKSDSVEYNVGERLLVYNDINSASNARNPGDFDYKEYLKSIDVYGQVYVDKNSIIKVSAGGAQGSVFLKIKQAILEQLAQSGLDTGPRSMIEALVLGQRQNVDPEITRSFRDAGVIHILALSGLHVGIILLILQFLTQRMIRWKYGRWMQSIFIIVFLWCFAILTGMSPSIMRAVTMFSFVAVGMNIKRKASTFHSLTLSAFFLLLIDSRLLFQVGFQLSYMAVFAIVLLQPVIKNLWTWDQPIKNFFWNILSVTLAAQIGVAPLSIFYFHQLPGLFLLGNMLLLPMLPLIIGASLLLIALLFSGVPYSWLVISLNYTLQFIIKTVERISSYDQFIFKDIYLETYEVILCYLILFSCAFYIKPFLTRSKRERHIRVIPNWFFHVAAVGLIVLFSIKSYKELTPAPSQLLILHQSRGSAISYSNKEHAMLWTDLNAMDSTRQETSVSRLKNMLSHRSKRLDVLELENLIQVGDLTVLRIDSTGIWNNDFKNTVVWLTGAPKINLDLIIREIQPTAIISDGSNYRSSVDQWQKTCVLLNVPFYNTYNDGAIDLLGL
jgi:competence protein ComEC